MTADKAPLSNHHRDAIRVLVRYAVVAAIVSLLSGVLFQESSKKLDRAGLPTGLHMEATLQLALVHGHVMMVGVLVPIAMAGLMLLGRRAGGELVGRKSLLWLTRGYLPFAALSLALMLWKGYHVLLGVRGGEHDLSIIDENFMFGIGGLRHGLYGLCHVAMAVGLVVYLIGVWRSLPRGR